MLVSLMDLMVMNPMVEFVKTNHLLNKRKLFNHFVDVANGIYRLRGIILIVIWGLLIENHYKDPY